MKLALVQKDCRDTDYRKWLTQAAALKPDLIVLGELATTGCMYQPRPFESFENVIAETGKMPGPVILGTPRRDGEHLRNTAVYIHGGDYQIYDKVNLFPPMNEPAVYTPGEKTGLFETPFGPIGVAICYDLRFDDLFADMKKRGAVMAIVPAAFPLVRIDAWKNLLVERAKNHDLTVIGVNAVGDDGTNEFGGSTTVVRPGGEVVLQADEKSPGILEVELAEVVTRPQDKAN